MMLKNTTSCEKRLLRVEYEIASLIAGKQKEHGFPDEKDSVKRARNGEFETMTIREQSIAHQSMGNRPQTSLIGLMSNPKFNMPPHVQIGALVTTLQEQGSSNMVGSPLAST